MSLPEIRLTIPLRWRDIDMLGHLNQAVYHELLEEARAGLFQQLGAVAEKGATWVVARVELDYRSEVRKDHGHVEVTARVARVGTKSITLEHEVLRADGVVAASGLTVLVGWDMVGRCGREISPAERELLGAAAAAQP